MGSVQYKHASMFGTFNIDCEVIGKSNTGEYYIRFTDPYTNEIMSILVPHDSLIFPTFNEYMVP